LQSNVKDFEEQAESDQSIVMVIRACSVTCSPALSKYMELTPGTTPTGNATVWNA